MMREIILAAAILTIIACGGFTQDAIADEARLVRPSKNVRHVCVGPKCGPYAPCGARCRTICPAGYSCFPLYGGYGPYGGIGYWGGYTFSGWGAVW